MTTLAKLVIKLITDVSEFEAGVQASTKKIEKFGSDMTKLGGSLDKYVTLPLAAAGVASLKFAADLDDAMSNSAKTFGESAKVIEKWSATAAHDLGMSKAAATQAAVGFGEFAKGMGNTQAKAAEMSTAMIGLATDLAELHGEDPTKVMEALQSGMAGRAQGVKQYGIVLDEATLKSKALALGIWDGAAAFTDSIKSQAAYASILEQTADIQGYYANQTGDMGKSLAELKAKAEDLLATFGQKLLPVAIQFMESLIPILDFFANLPPGVQQAIVYLAMFAASLGPILTVGGNLVTLFGTISGAFATGGALAGMGTFFSGLVPTLTAAGGALGGIAAGFGAILGPALVIGIAIAGLIITIQLFGKQASETLGMIGYLIDALIKGIGEKLAEINRSITDAIRGAVYGIGTFISSFFTAGANLIAGFINGILNMATSVVQTVSDVVRWTIDAVKKLLGIASPSKIFSDMGENMMLGLGAGVDKFASVPVNATMEAVGATIPAAGDIQPGGSMRSGISIGPITFQGDLSESQKASLEVWINQIFGENMLNLLETS